MDTTGRRWYQIQSLRDITGSNFTSGQIRFNFSIDGETSWNPSKSYFKMRHNINGVKYSTSDLMTNLQLGHGIGPTMFFNDCFWQHVEVRVNGICLNKADSYYQQIAALRHRFNNEEMNKVVNKLNFHETSLGSRLLKLTSDGHKYNSPDVVDLYYLYLNKISGDRTVQFSYNAGGGVFTLVPDGVEGSRPLLHQLVKPGDVIVWRLSGGEDEIGIYNIYDVTGLSLTLVRLSGTAIANQVQRYMTPGEITLYSRNGTVLSKDDIPYKKFFETMWKPQMGFFDQDAWLPGGEYEIILTPYPSASYKYHIMEAFSSKGIEDIDYNMIDMNYYVCMANRKSSETSIKFIDTKCLVKTINVSSYNQKQFIINPHTFALTIAFQDARYTSDYAVPDTKFKIQERDDLGRIVNRSWERNLTRFSIQFDNDLLPNPEPDVRATGVEEFITQQYWETQNSKVLMDSDIETLEEWFDRGMYFHFQWPRKNNEAKEVQVACEFKGQLPEGTKPNLLLFYHYKVSYSFAVQGGKIMGVKKGY